MVVPEDPERWVLKDLLVMTDHKAQAVRLVHPVLMVPKDLSDLPEAVP
jgi:hypothetical protein